MAGAPLGNKNGAKGKSWAMAIERALSKRSRVAQVEALDELADKLISLGMSGDLAALKEIGDRLDGKPKQQTEISGPNGGPIETVEHERPKLMPEEWLKLHGVKPRAEAQAEE